MSDGRELRLCSISQLRFYQRAYGGDDMKARMTIRLFGATLCAVLAASTTHAADCPDSETAKEGFVLEMPGVSSTFRQLDESVVQVENSYEASSPQTQFFFGGLIEVFRTSKTGQFALLPFSDLRDVLPLETGAHHKLSWILLERRTTGPNLNRLSCR
jgi:hypothetical protein